MGQLSKLQLKRTMEKELDPSGWMKCYAQVVRMTWMSAFFLAGESIIVATQRMRVSDVKVCE